MVDSQPFRLEVRTVRAAGVRSFIPVQAQPAVSSQQRIKRAGHYPPPVGIFDTQNERPAVMAGEQIVKQRRPQSANGQVSGRTGGKSNANGHTLPRAMARAASSPAGPRADCIRRCTASEPPVRPNRRSATSSARARSVGNGASKSSKLPSRG